MNAHEFVSLVAGMQSDGEERPCPDCDGKSGKCPTCDGEGVTYFDMSNDDTHDAFSSLIGYARDINREVNSDSRFTDAEVATILHGLRIIQCESRIEGCNAGDCDHFEEVPSLINTEIDELCERINIGPTRQLCARCLTEVDPEDSPLDKIVALLSGTEWNAGTLNDIVAVVRAAGYDVKEISINAIPEP